MKKKYITAYVLLASLSERTVEKKDIHEQIKETIAEREKIMNRMEEVKRAGRVMDMYLGVKAA